MRVVVDADFSASGIFTTSVSTSTALASGRHRRLLSSLVDGGSGSITCIADGEHRVQRGHGLLEHHGDLVAADPPHLLVRQLEEITPAVKHLALRHPAGRRRDQPHDRERRDALAAPRLAHEPQCLARLDGEIQPVHRRKLAVRGDEGCVEILDFEQCRHGTQPPPPPPAPTEPQARTVPKNGRGANDRAAIRRYTPRTVGALCAGVPDGTESRYVVAGRKVQFSCGLWPMAGGPPFGGLLAGGT